MGERSYYEDIIIAMSKHGFLMRREADGFQLLNEGQADQQKISQPRATDLFGIITNGTGKYVACEVKLFPRDRHHPIFSDFRTSQRNWLTQIEKYGGVSLVCYVNRKNDMAHWYGWLGGEFTQELFKEQL